MLEITNLIIPGLNDKKETFREMVRWIKNECGEQTVFHISRYFPHYRSNLPPTSPETLNDLFDIATKDLKYVYSGNYENVRGSTTFCPKCGSPVIIRKAYDVRITGLDNQGACIYCGTHIIRDFQK